MGKKVSLNQDHYSENVDVREEYPRKNEKRPRRKKFAARYKKRKGGLK